MPGKPAQGLPQSTQQRLGPWLAGQQIRNLEIRIDSVPLVNFSGIVVDPPLNAEAKLVRAGGPIPVRRPHPVPLVDGKFEFSLLPEGDYVLQIGTRNFPKQASADVPIHIGAFEDLRNQRIVLPQLAQLTGTLRLNGKPYFDPGFFVSMSHMKDGAYTSAEAKMHEDGSFELSGLTPGEWSVGTRIRVSSARRRNLAITGWHRIKLVSGVNPPIVVDLEETATVRGEIVDSNGMPTKGVVVFKTQADTPARFNLAGQDGNFMIGLALGKYQVSAWPIGFSSSYTDLPACPYAQTITAAKDTSGLQLRLCP